jgi:lipoate-protein ligase B
VCTDPHVQGSEDLTARGIEVHRVSRGGDVTYHAPGQLVGCLIVDLAARARAAVGAARANRWR